MSERELRAALTRLLNLANHPMFPTLPLEIADYWTAAKAQARAALAAAKGAA